VREHPVSEADVLKLEEEKEEELVSLAKKHRACLLCLIAPFIPERVAPGLAVYAELRYPEELLIEEFVNIVDERFPEEKPQLFILIHSPGGFINSAYIIAKTLRSRFKRMVAFIPHIAASGAALLALACDEIVMGDISRLTPIDPYFRENDKIIYPKSVLSALSVLEGYFKTIREEEAPYPYKHLANQLNPELVDRCARLLDLVKKYARELLEKAEYDEERIEKILKGIVDEPSIHDEVLTLERLKNLGLRAYHYKEKKEYISMWKIMRKWLEKYYFKPSRIHIIRYVIPPR